jgi:hypothetical protein
LNLDKQIQSLLCYHYTIRQINDLRRFALDAVWIRAPAKATCGRLRANDAVSKHRTSYPFKRDRERYLQDGGKGKRQKHGAHRLIACACSIANRSRRRSPQRCFPFPVNHSGDENG